MDKSMANGIMLSIHQNPHDKRQPNSTGFSRETCGTRYSTPGDPLGLPEQKDPDSTRLTRNYRMLPLRLYPVPVLSLSLEREGSSKKNPGFIFAQSWFCDTRHIPVWYPVVACWCLPRPTTKPKEYKKRRRDERRSSATSNLLAEVCLSL